MTQLKPPRVGIGKRVEIFAKSATALWQRRVAAIHCIRFNRHELAGSFGDIGTVLPLLMGMLLATDLDAASVFTVFGAIQIAMGVYYGAPIPVQPLKAVAIMVITSKIVAATIFGAGFTIGLVMLLLTVTGGLNWLARIIPLCVVRGIQLGLGLSLGALALKTYIPTQGINGYVLAGACFVIMLILGKNRHLPGGLLLIGIGIGYAILFKLDWHTITTGVSFTLPKLHQPALNDMLTGFFVLALPQLPLSISNSVIATQQAATDFFPERKVTVKKIGFTYSLLNLATPFISGVPVCHGCGGLAGYYALGARTGGAVIINGAMYVVLGLFFSHIFSHVTAIFPQPILGVVLLFEALALMMLIKDVCSDTRNLQITLIVALLAFTLPQGYLIGIVVGLALFYLTKKRK